MKVVINKGFGGFSISKGAARHMAYAGNEEALTVAAHAGELQAIVKAFVAETVDYMTRNHLGDPEKQHNVKWARSVLAKSPQEGGGSTPPHSQRPGGKGAGFDSPEVAQGAEGAAGTADRAAAESVAGATNTPHPETRCPQCGTVHPGYAALCVYAEHIAEQARATLSIAANVQCGCSLRERDSGHRVECWMPELRFTLDGLSAALAKNPVRRPDAKYCATCCGSGYFVLHGERTRCPAGCKADESCLGHENPNPASGFFSDNGGHSTLKSGESTSGVGVGTVREAAKDRAAMELTAALCELPVTQKREDDPEFISRERAMDLVTSWRRKWDAANKTNPRHRQGPY